MGQKKSIKVSPFWIIRIKLTKESRANYTFLTKISTKPNKICINLLHSIE